LVPRNVGFLIYYYPAAMILGLVIVAAIRIARPPDMAIGIFLAATWAAFIYFYPVSTAEPMDANSIPRRMIFPAWSETRFPTGKGLRPHIYSENQ
jgi:dolichyl-phosphate-mannose--protein O-mannosyl transferase